MTLKLGVACASLVVLMAACNSSRQQAAPSPIPTSQAPVVLNVAPSVGPTGVIIGSVGPCSAIPPPTGPMYYPAFVTVRRGAAVWEPMPNGWTVVFPNDILASTALKARQPYRLVVSPGEYVLTSRYLPPGNLAAWINVTVTAGQTVQADLDPVCK